MFLQHCGPASLGVRLPGVALKSHYRTDEGIGVVAAQRIIYAWTSSNLLLEVRDL